MQLFCLLHNSTDLFPTWVISKKSYTPLWPFFLISMTKPRTPLWTLLKVCCMWLSMELKPQSDPLTWLWIQAISNGFLHLSNLSVLNDQDKESSPSIPSSSTLWACPCCFGKIRSVAMRLPNSEYPSKNAKVSMCSPSSIDLFYVKLCAHFRIFEFPIFSFISKYTINLYLF